MKTYIESLDDGRLSFEKEVLTEVDLYNEYVMTNLRTMWGIDAAKVEDEYGTFWRQVGGALQKYLNSGDLVERDGKIRISERGWVISDAILSDLFVV